MCAFVDRSDREALVQVGFSNSQGDGDVSIIQLSADDTLPVIRLESLIVGSR
jgi:hypothetical protein